MKNKPFNKVSFKKVDDLVFGRALRPVALRSGMVIGGGTVYPEINFTLPSMLIDQSTMPEVRRQYREMTAGVLERARQLFVAGVVVEIELLPPLTFNPDWGEEVIREVKDVMEEYQGRHNLPSALRLTPVDIREGDVEHMWRGAKWDTLLEVFRRAGKAGADLLAIESVGGKNLHDDAVMYGDIRKALFALGVVGARDMAHLWSAIAQTAADTNAIPSGDTACGFANTAMVLADRGYVPKVFAAVVRAMSGVRSLVAYEQGAQGPHKDCGYEGVYVKAITGTPISMEGKTSACAHLSPVGNIAAAMADLWSNESVENVKLLGGMAPTIYLEQLAYDCRLMNQALADGQELVLRNLFVESDSRYDPQAYVLRPEAVLEVSQAIVQGKTHFEQTLNAGRRALALLKEAYQAGRLRLAAREQTYLDTLDAELETVSDEEELTHEMVNGNTTEKFHPEKYNLQRTSQAASGI